MYFDHYFNTIELQEKKQRKTVRDGTFLVVEL